MIESGVSFVYPCVNYIRQISLGEQLTSNNPEQEKISWDYFDRAEDVGSWESAFLLCLGLSPSGAPLWVSLELGEMLCVGPGAPPGDLCGVSGLHTVPAMAARHRVSLRPAQSHWHL